MITSDLRAVSACRRCRGRHAFGHHAVGSRVEATPAAAARAGWPSGTKGTVARWTILAGAVHQEVHVRRGSLEAVFAPCELASDEPAGASAKPSEWASYVAMTRGEFLALLDGYGCTRAERGRARGRVLSDVALLEHQEPPRSRRR